MRAPSKDQRAKSHFLLSIPLISVPLRVRKIHWEHKFGDYGPPAPKRKHLAKAAAKVIIDKADTEIKDLFIIAIGPWMDFVFYSSD